MILRDTLMTDDDVAMMVDVLCGLLDDLKRAAYELWLYGPDLVEALAVAYPEEDL